MLHQTPRWTRSGDRVTVSCPLQDCHEEPWILRTAIDKDGCCLIDCPKHRLVAVHLIGGDWLIDLLVPRSAQGAA